MSLENTEAVREDGHVIELRLWFKDHDGDKVRFDIDPDGELWIHAGRSIVILSEDDVKILLTKMQETFAQRATT